MNNVFGGNMFTPLRGGERDPYEEIINDFQTLQSQAPARQVLSGGNINPPISKPPKRELTFGGVIDSPDPYMRQSRPASEALYESYKKPQVTAGEILGKAGIKPNEQFPSAYDDEDERLNREEKRSRIDLTKANIDLSKRRVTDQENRTAIAKYKSENPNRVLKVIDGKLISFDPKTNQAIDTGIHGLSREDELQIMHDNEIKELITKHAAELDSMRNKPTEPPNPLNESRELLNRAQKFKIENPDLARYVRVNGDQIEITIDPRDKDYEKIRQALYPPKSNPTPNPPSVNSVVNPPSNASPSGISSNTSPSNNMVGEYPVGTAQRKNPRTGQVENVIRVRNKQTGQTGTLPVNQFNAERYERIQ